MGSNPTEETSLFHHSSMVEHSAVNRRVVGSSPTGGAMWTGIQVRLKGADCKSATLCVSLVRIQPCPPFLFLRGYGVLVT